MAYTHQTTRVVSSEVCPGVKYYLIKMTEGRRLDLRARINVHQKHIKSILKELSEVDRQLKELGTPPTDADRARDLLDRSFELMDEVDQINVEHVNPSWIEWGVRKIEGLEVDGAPLDVDKWKEWPSMLFQEILDAVQAEAQLNGGEIKNSSSPTTSGDLTDGTQKRSTAGSADEKGSGAAGTADFITPIV